MLENLRRKSEICFLISALVVSFLLRTYKNTEIPPGFYPDEALFAKNSYSLATKGTDELGNRFPIFFNAFDTYQGAIFLYMAAPFLSIFGESEFAIRLAAGFYGTLTVLPLYFLLKYTLNNKLLTFLTVVSLALSFSHIHFSRIGWEIISYPFFLFTSLALFFISIKKQKTGLFLLSFLGLGLTQYSRFNARLEVPVILILLLLLFKKYISKFNKKVVILGFAIYLLTTVPFLTLSMQGKYFNRLNQLNNSVLKISSKEALIKYGENFLQTYFYHFSPKFLFIEGDKFLRHTIPGFGMLPITTLPFFYLGIIILLTESIKQTKDTNRAFKIFILLLLLIWPIAPSLTLEHLVHRAISGVIIINIIICYSVSVLITVLFSRISLPYKKITVLFIATCLFLLPLIFFWKNYSTKYLESANAWSGWPYGIKEIVAFYNKQTKFTEFYIDPLISPDINQYLIDFYSNNSINYHLGGVEKVDISKLQLFAFRESDVEKSVYPYTILKEIKGPTTKTEPILIVQF